MGVEKRGNRWCVVHGHPIKSGSLTDKPKGSIIKCYSGPGAKEKALKQHQAIIISQAQGKQ